MSFLKLHFGLMLALSIFMSTVVPSNVQAVTVNEYKMTAKQATASVDEVFQKFQYAMSVEWDQKDESFKQQAEKDLINSLLALVESGISLDEIQAHMQKTILSAEARVEYQRLVDAMEGQNLSKEEITTKTLEFMKKAQAQGLSFNGEGGSGGHSKWTLIVVVIIVVVVTQLCLNGRGNDHHDDHDHDYDHNHNYAD